MRVLAGVAFSLKLQGPLPSLCVVDRMHFLAAIDRGPCFLAGCRPATPLSSWRLAAALCHMGPIGSLQHNCHCCFQAIGSTFSEFLLGRLQSGENSATGRLA